MTGVDMLGCLLPPATGDQGGTHFVDCDHVVSVHSGHPVIIEEVSDVPRPPGYLDIYMVVVQPGEINPSTKSQTGRKRVDRHIAMVVNFISTK